MTDSAQSDLIKLYSQRILALAADIPHIGRLPAPMATVQQRAPLCGSTITVDIVVRDGQITEFSQDVKACALGQAAAAVVGAQIIGCTRDQVATARNQIYAMLTTEGPPPTTPFDGLEVLQPARDYKNRHASIMLALEASLEAFDQAQQTEQTQQASKPRPGPVHG